MDIIDTSEWQDRINPQLNIIGSAQDETDYIDPKRALYDHELMCFGSGGEYHFEFDDKEVICPENSYILIPPARWHTVRAIKPSYRTWIHFHWTWVTRENYMPLITYAPMSIARKHVQRKPRWIPSLPEHGPLLNPDTFFEMHQRLSERQNQGTSRERMNTRPLLLEILLKIFGIDAAYDWDYSSEHRMIARIRESLRKLSQQPFNRCPSIKEILEETGYSNDHLTRLFKKAYGITPLQYVNAQRMERAKHLITDSHLHIAEVATKLGFDDPTYFQRLFRKVCGYSPGQQRKKT